MTKIQSAEERDEALEAYLNNFQTSINDTTADQFDEYDDNSKSSKFDIPAKQSISKSKSNLKVRIPFDTTNKQHKNIYLERSHCCGTSRCIYCPECCKIFLSKSDLPPPLQTNNLKLPFHLDILLNDRRAVATGIHAYMLLGDSFALHEDSSADVFSLKHENMGSLVKLIDLEKGESIPNYGPNRTENENRHSSSNHESGDRNICCVLFPSQDSVPLSSVAHTISRLIVLDCKWTRSSLKKCAQLSSLTKVHLTSPPQTSHYWRWHNAGPGMISTIEAIYCAAWEVMNAKLKSRTSKDHNQTKALESIPDILATMKTMNVNDQACTEQSQNEKEQVKATNQYSDVDLNSLLHLLFLFGLQRALVRRAALQEGRSLPYSEQGKHEQRALRKYAGTEKQARDKENGKRLKEKRRNKILKPLQT